MTAIDTLVDQFTSLDTSKWTFSAAVAAVDGRARVLPDVLYDFDIASVSRYDLTGTRIFVEVPQVLSAAGTDTEFSLFLDNPSDNDNLRFVVEDGTLIFGVRTAGVGSNTTATYNAVDHRWWQLRESGGTIYFDTSADGITWTTRRTAAPPMAVTSCQVVFITGYFGADPGAAYAFFDNVNFPPPVGDAHTTFVRRYRRCG